jgi:hypothetical protein
MPHLEYDKGLAVTPDVYFATALMSRNAIKKGSVVDFERTLPPVELSHVYIRVIKRPASRKRRRGAKAHIVYTGPGHPPPRAMVRIPLVMFAFKPFRETHELTKRKNEAWHDGTLITPPLTYRASHEKLRRKIKNCLDVWRSQTGAGDAAVKEKARGHELLVDGKTLVLEAGTEVPNARIDGED